MGLHVSQEGPDAEVQMLPPPQAVARIPWYQNIVRISEPNREPPRRDGSALLTISLATRTDS
jgi:hypothetical protein